MLSGGLLRVLRGAVLSSDADLADLHGFFMRDACYTRLVIRHQGEVSKDAHEFFQLTFELDLIEPTKAGCSGAS